VFEVEVEVEVEVSVLTVCRRRGYRRPRPVGYRTAACAAS
jgi:hypothetical protein